MLFSTDYFTAMAKKDKYAAGSLDSLADGVLLNQRDIARILGITAPTAGKLLKNNNFKIIRLTSGRTSPVFIYAGELKRFLEKGGAPLQPTVNQPLQSPPARKGTSSPTPPATDEPTDEPTGDLYEIAAALGELSIFNEKNEPKNSELTTKTGRKRKIGYGSPT